MNDLTAHPSHDDHHHCPLCGATVYPIYWWSPDDTPVPPAERWLVWTARCWNKHRVRRQGDVWLRRTDRGD